MRILSWNVNGIRAVEKRGFVDWLVKENPDILSASSSARDWIESGAPGSLRFQEPHAAEYMQEGDREAIKRILTQGGLSKWNNKSNKLPVDMIVSPERKAMMMDNDKGAFLLGGLNSGAKPWVTMMLNRENLKLDIAQFIGENAVIYLDGSLKICDFSDPENLIFSGMPDTPELRALGDVSIIKVESLGKVSCMSVLTGRRNYAVLILDLTDGIRSAKVKVIAIEDKARSPEIAFFGDGTVLINAHQKVCPEEWGGIKRETAEPAKLMPSNNTSAPIARIAGNFGSGTTLVRHSMEYRSISTTEEIRSFEFSCLWKFAPYSFLAMAFDNSPASGGSVMLHFEGDFFIARIDRDDVSPPDRAEWLMMKAVSGEVAKKRRETISNAASEYERILKDGDYGRIGSLCASLRTLVENRDENAFALWQRIQRDFPRGKPFMAVECEAKPPEKEFLYHVKHAKPVYPSMPFSHPSAIGKIKYSYNYRNEAQALIISNKVSFPLEISAVGEFRIVTAAEPSGDGLFQALFYSRSGEDERLIIGRKGVMIRVIDVKGPECVFELVLPSLQIQEIFVRWYYHTMLIYVGSFGIFHIDFDEPGAPDSKLPPPIIPELTELHDVFFIGEHADDLFTGENRFRLCFEVLPFPSNPMNDERLNNFLPVLPKKPDERRAVLLANGFGNLWTERILREKPR